MKFPFLIAFCLIHFFVNAQVWNWARTANSITATQAAGFTNNVCADNSGNVIVLGNTYGKANYSNTTLDSGSFVIKYDTLGNFKWAKHIDNTAKDIATDMFGNIYVLDGSIDTVAYYDLYKFNSSGNLIWKKKYGGFASAFAVDDAGNIYVTGSNAAGFSVSKFKPDGAEGWTRRGPTNCSTGCFLRGWLLCLDKRKTVYVIGNAGYSNCNYCGSWFLAKYDTLGNLTYSNSKWDQYADVFQLAVDDSLNIYTMYYTGGHYFLGYDLAKYDSLLNPVWINNYNAYGLAHFTGGLSVDKNNNVYLGGSLGYDDGPGVDSVLMNDQWVRVKGLADIMVSKFNSNGKLVSFITAGGRENEGLSDAYINKFGDCFVSGYISNNIPGAAAIPKDTVTFGNDTLISTSTWPQMFVAKINFNGSPTNIQSFANSSSTLSLFPNPTSDLLTVQLKNNQLDAKIIVYDILANRIIEKNCKAETNPQIDLSSMPKGIYFVEIISENQTAVKKIIVR